MFDIGWSELLVIGVVALIAIGPKELPGVLRAVGQWTGKIRRMAAEFQGQFQEALREAEMADLKKQVDELNQTARSITQYDPLADTAKPVAAAAPSTTPAEPAEGMPVETTSVETTPVESAPVETAPIPPVSEEPAALQPLPAVEPVAAAAATVTPPPATVPAHADAGPKPEEGRPA